MPAAWNIGATTSQLVSEVNGQQVMKCWALATRLPWVRITPFDAPVVPPVSKRPATLVLGDLSPCRLLGRA